jgi:cysteine-rich repeat protein
VNSFDGSAFFVRDNAVITGNFVGTDPSGTVARGNGLLSATENARQTAIVVFGFDNRIGGPTAADGNLISGNDGAGIFIRAQGTIVQGNFIGPDATGTIALGNGTFGGDSGGITGASLSGWNNVFVENLLSGNFGHGLRISNFGEGSIGNVVARNWIGTDVTGDGALGNGEAGIQVGLQGAVDGTVIGGLDPVDGNVIAFNQGAGVVVIEGEGNVILSNRIFANEDVDSPFADLGIDLVDAPAGGVTENDVHDLDTGPNGLQNAPFLSSFDVDMGMATGSLHSAPAEEFTLQFFSNAICDPTGYGEGEELVGAVEVTTDASGNATFDVMLMVDAESGPFLTATATGEDGTSEFSRCLESGTMATTTTSTSITPGTTSTSTTMPVPPNQFTLFGTVSDGSSGPNDNTLVIVDPQSGAQSLAGAIGGAVNARAIDWSPTTHTLFGTDLFDDPGVIREIDPATGVSTPVATIRDGVDAVQLGALAFAADGTLYAVAGGNLNVGLWLGTIDLVAETFNPVLPVPQGLFVLGIDISPAGILYAVYSDLSGSPQTLVAVDLGTISVVSVKEISGSLAVNDIDYARDGFIYHSNFSFALGRIDPASAIQTNIGFGALGALSGIASTSAPLDPPECVVFPPAGSDSLETDAVVTVQISPTLTDVVELSGPTVISRGDPEDLGDGLRQVPTEMIGLTLTGHSLILGDLTVRESSTLASTGLIRARQSGSDYPADSFFDVFFELETNLPPPLHQLRNAPDDPLRMRQVIDCIPPLGAIYQPPPGQQVISLLSEAGDEVAVLIHAQHEVVSPFCGDGIAQPWEECDDGNRVDCDGCDRNCTPMGCGNHVVCAPESCDDGNLAAGDGCRPDCSIEACGDGVVDPQETCEASDDSACPGECLPPGGVPECTCAVPPECLVNSDCDDANPCTDDECDALGTCGNTPNTAACDDGNACTEGDTCGAGACIGTPVICGALDQCHVVGICDPATGECSGPAAADGVACDDADAGTVMDQCYDGACVGAFDDVLLGVCDSLPAKLERAIKKRTKRAEKVLRKAGKAAARGKDKKVARFRRQAVKQLEGILKTLAKVDLDDACRAEIERLVALRVDAIEGAVF